MAQKRRLKLIVAYDGTAYHGWQRQAGSRLATVQGTMEAALAKLLREPVSLTAASRTDAGVHARGQVVSLVTGVPIPLERWPLATASVLPADMAVLQATEVAPDFNPRYHARSKTYQYTIDNGRTADVFGRCFAYHIALPLDEAKMAQAAGYFEGSHDYRAFCASGSPVKTFRRQVFSCRVSRRGSKVVVTVSGNGFLYNMVRIMAGTLVQVGLAKIDPSEIEAILASGRRERAGPTLPPQGLCLENVSYGEP